MTASQILKECSDVTLLTINISRVTYENETLEIKCSETVNQLQSGTTSKPLLPRLFDFEGLEMRVVKEYKRLRYYKVKRFKKKLEYFEKSCLVVIIDRCLRY